MSSEWELNDGIESIKRAWQREHTAKVIIEKTLENTCAENAKLRELARLLLYGATHDAEPAEGLVWSQKVDVLARKLGIEVEE